MTDVEQLDPQDVADARAMLVVDVRPLVERLDGLGYIPGSISLPIDPMPEGLAATRVIPAARPVVFVCRSGRRSDEVAQAVARSREPGTTANLEGGFLAWQAAELEVAGLDVAVGDLVAVDTDMIGPFGYDADISRTFFCGPGKPNAWQQDLYRYAWDQLHHNIALVRPGCSFRELSEASYELPERYREQEMAMVWHGVGLYGQWPTIVAKRYFDPEIADKGLVEPGMTLCCESYVGALGGAEGVKLEQMLLVTESGVELLNSFPFEEALLGRSF